MSDQESAQRVGSQNGPKPTYFDSRHMGETIPRGLSEFKIPFARADLGRVLNRKFQVFLTAAPLFIL
jgi:hypothetical protein